MFFMVQRGWLRHRRAENKNNQKIFKRNFFALFYGKDRKTLLRDNLSKGKQTNRPKGGR